MTKLIADPTELWNRGFQALVDALGWRNAVRFLHQSDPGSGNYTEERKDLLPDWDAAKLVEAARKQLEPAADPES